jgi:hypothetical protein
MSQCNYCSFRDIKRHAKEKGMQVIVQTGWRDGLDIFVVPMYVKKSDAKKWRDVSDDEPNGGPERQKYLVMWCMSIPERCEC